MNTRERMTGSEYLQYLLAFTFGRGLTDMTICASPLSIQAFEVILIYPHTTYHTTGGSAWGECWEAGPLQTKKAALVEEVTCSPKGESVANKGLPRGMRI